MRAPVGCCGIVLGFKFGLVVHKAIVAITAVGAILYQLVESGAIAPLVVVPFIYILGSSLAPCEVVAIFLGAAGANVHRCPQCAAW